MDFKESLARKLQLLTETGKKNRTGKMLVVLLVDNDEDDLLLVDSAFGIGPMRVDLRWTSNGQEAMDYLLQRGNFKDPKSSPRPDLILLDIRASQIDRLRTLREIRANHKFNRIPVVLLTDSTSAGGEDESSRRKLMEDYFNTNSNDLQNMISLLGDLHESYSSIIRLPDSADPPQNLDAT